MNTTTKTKANHCDAPGHEECTGWITCDHAGVELEFDGNADYEWWCPRCGEAAVGKVRTWCPERTN
jgi:predicted RNA-binding Zn-ribbon protein involved in translation (DUF1610 family)